MTETEEKSEVLEVCENARPPGTTSRYRYCFEDPSGLIAIGDFATVAEAGRKAKARCGSLPWAIINDRGESVWNSAQHNEAMAKFSMSDTEVFEDANLAHRAVDVVVSKLLASGAFKPIPEEWKVDEAECNRQMAETLARCAKHDVDEEAGARMAMEQDEQFGQI